MSIGRMIEVSATAGQSLWARWDDGARFTIDLAPLIRSRPALAPLADAREFARAALSADGWSVEWPCGVDFGAAQLRRWADEQAGRAMPAAALREWIDRHGFTLDRAADALGLSRRTVAYYLSGEQVIPKTVMLATKGFDHRTAA